MKQYYWEQKEYLSIKFINLLNLDIRVIKKINLFHKVLFRVRDIMSFLNQVISIRFLYDLYLSKKYINLCYLLNVDSTDYGIILKQIKRIYIKILNNKKFRRNNCIVCEKEIENSIFEEYVFELYLNDYREIVDGYINKVGKERIGIYDLNIINSEFLSEKNFYEYYYLVLEEVKRNDEVFFHYIEKNMARDMFNISSQQVIGYSFCLDFPFSELSYIHLETDNTFEDIFNLLHELGHMYYFFYRKMNNIEYNHNIINEIFAYSFEVIFIYKLGDRFLIREYIKKTIVNMVYRLIYMKFEYMIKKEKVFYDEISNTFNKILYDVYKDKLEVTDLERELMWLANEDFILYSESIVEYVISNIYALTLFINKKNPLQYLKNVCKWEYADETILFKISNGKNLKKIIVESYKFLHDGLLMIE